MPPVIRRRWIERFPGRSPVGYNVPVSWGKQKLVKIGEPYTETTVEAQRRLAFQTAWHREARELAEAASKRRELQAVTETRTQEIEQIRQEEAKPGMFAEALKGLRTGGVLAAVALAGLAALMLAGRGGDRRSW